MWKAGYGGDVEAPAGNPTPGSAHVKDEVIGTFLFNGREHLREQGMGCFGDQTTNVGSVVNCPSWVKGCRSPVGSKIGPGRADPV